MESMIPQVLESVFQKAIAGDMTAARVLLDRTLPSKRPAHEFVEISHTGDIAADSQAVLRGVFNGDLSPDVGATILNAMTGVLRAIEVDELAKRLETLERAKL
jgi:hypothetical protein